MRPRKLNILDINDRIEPNFRPGRGKALHFQLKRLQTWKAVQANLADKTPSRPDILLIDIDFREDPSLRSVDFQCGKIKPFGPFLALPYLNSRPICAVAVYSGHMPSRPEQSHPVLINPWFLLPIGLIAASQSKVVFSSATLGDVTPSEPAVITEPLETFLTKLGQYRAGNVATALANALILYQEALNNALNSENGSGRIRITNAEVLVKTLEAQKAALIENPNKTSATIDLGDDAFVEIYSESHGLDRILIRSLWADVFGFEETELDVDGIEDILKFLRHFAKADTIFQKVVNVIREREKCGAAFDTVATDLYGGLPDHERREILQLGVLLANVHAWAEGDFARWQQNIAFDRLGISRAGINRYSGWFGMRRRQAKEEPTQSKVCGRSLKIDPIDRFRTSGGGHTLFLEWGESHLSVLDKERIRHYLRAFREEEGYQENERISFLDDEALDDSGSDEN